MNALLRCPATVTDSSNSDICIPVLRRDARGRPPPGGTPAHWRLLTPHPVATLVGAKQITHFFRQRGTIEQLFRVMKSKGFDIEAVHVADNGPFENFTTATLIAAIQVLQMVRERDGAGGRALEDVLDAAGQPALEPCVRPSKARPNGRTTPSKGFLGLCILGLRSARRMDRILRQARPGCNPPRLPPLQSHA